MANRDTRALVAHLFRRAGFGLRPDELDHFTRLGVQSSVDYLINYDQVTDPAETKYPLPDMSRYAPPQIPQAQRTIETQKAAGKLRAQGKVAIQEWWVNRMLATTRPLQEKMTLFWHGHFATAITKAPAVFMLQQNQMFRGQALGNFNALLKAVNQDPAMLLWLDGARNRAGKPNENFSRELMELFTLGVGHYTERDVREGARALTGWTVNRNAYYTGSIDTQALLRPRLHDNGIKTYLGHTGNLGSDDVMNILSAHPNTGGFIARKLFEFFAHDNAGGAELQPFIKTYYSSNYDIKSVIRQILLSDAFYSDQSFQQHFKSPAEYVLGTVRELGLSVPPLALVRAMTLMGQELFNPPNVGGWPGGSTWINEGTLVERFNFAGLLTAQHGTGASYLSQPRAGGGQTLEPGMDQNTQQGVAQSPLRIVGVNPQQLVSQSGAQNAAGLVNYVLTRFVGIGASPVTQAALASYLGPSLSPQMIETRVRGLVQLVLASPEYQLN